MDDTEPENAGLDHGVPDDLVELHEVLEYGLALEVPTE